MPNNTIDLRQYDLDGLDFSTVTLNIRGKDLIIQTLDGEIIVLENVLSESNTQADQAVTTLLVSSNNDEDLLLQLYKNDSVSQDYSLHEVFVPEIVNQIDTTSVFNNSDELSYYSNTSFESANLLPSTGVSQTISNSELLLENDYLSRQQSTVSAYPPADRVLTITNLQEAEAEVEVEVEIVGNINLNKGFILGAQNDNEQLGPILQTDEVIENPSAILEYIIPEDLNQVVPLVATSTQPLVITEGLPFTLTAATLGVSNIADGAVEIRVSNVVGGDFYLVDSTGHITGVAITQFTLAAVKSGSVIFSHDDSEQVPAFTIEARDNEPAALWVGPVAAVIDYNPVNDSPLVVTSTQPLVITEGQPFTLTAAALGVSDIDDADSAVEIRVSNVVGGDFYLVDSTGNITGVAITQFTLAAVNAGSVIFSHDDSEQVPAFTIEARDNEPAALWVGPVAAVIDYNPVNDNPPSIDLDDKVNGVDSQIYYLRDTNSAVAVWDNISISDTDGNNSGDIVSATIMFSGVVYNGFEVFTIEDIALTLGTAKDITTTNGNNYQYNGTNELKVTFTSGSSNDTVQSILKTASYQYTGVEVAPSPRTLSVALFDGINASNSSSLTIDLAPKPIVTVENLEISRVDSFESDAAVLGQVEWFLGDIVRIRWYDTANAVEGYSGDGNSALLNINRVQFDVSNLNTTVGTVGVVDATQTSANSGIWTATITITNDITSPADLLSQVTAQAFTVTDDGSRESGSDVVNVQRIVLPNSENTVEGTAQNDIIVLADNTIDYQDIVDGGEGNDVLDYTKVSDGLIIDAQAGLVGSDSNGLSDLYLSIEEIWVSTAAKIDLEDPTDASQVQWSLVGNNTLAVVNLSDGNHISIIYKDQLIDEGDRSLLLI